MKYHPADFGETSRGNPELQHLWNLAEQKNERLPRDANYRYVPRPAVFIDETIAPREQANADPEVVSHYAEIYDQLPPIEVQAKTFVLIDGVHRLHAAWHEDVDRHVIAVRERDIPDDLLRQEAFDTNSKHGRPLKKRERVAFARWLLEQHPEMPDVQIAKRAGISRQTVSNYRTPEQHATPRVVTDGDRVYEKPITRPKTYDDQKVAAKSAPVQEEDPWGEPAEAMPGTVKVQGSSYESLTVSPEEIEHTAIKVPNTEPQTIVECIKCLASVSMPATQFVEVLTEERKAQMQQDIVQACTFIDRVEELIAKEAQP